MSFKVSICCITYNHEKYIEQAIQSFLMQKTGFDFEIVIADDASSDHTSETIQKYAEQYPGKIRFFRHDVNIGMMRNFQFALQICAGEYIAICEGDDYWIDENKLQTQVAFLEANHEYAICFHRVYLLEENKELSLSDLNMSDKQESLSILDIAKQNIIHTPSVVFRNGLIPNFPVWFSQSPVGDYVLHLLNAKRGLIKYFPEPMAVYRKHNSSTWSSLKRIDLLEKWLKVLGYLIQEFEGEVKAILEEQYYGCTLELAHLYKIENNTEEYYNTLIHYLGKEEGAFKVWLKKDWVRIQQLDVEYPRGIKQSFNHLLRALKTRIQ
jgi:glycosyltransferase involved in cell wall biosynthesis